MPLGSWATHEFPNLTLDNYTEASQATRRYNCIAWAAGENTRKWWPDQLGIGYWPAGAPREQTMGAFVQAFETLGYRLCFGGSMEAGIEKIALFGREQEGVVVPTHAALQLESGEWTSKLGDYEDINHVTPEVITGPFYGQVVYYLARPRH